MKQKLIFLIVPILLVAVIFSGCSSPAPEVKETNKAKIKADAAKDAAPTVKKLSLNETFLSYLGFTQDKMNKTYGQITQVVGTEPRFKHLYFGYQVTYSDIANNRLTDRSVVNGIFCRLANLYPDVEVTEADFPNARKEFEESEKRTHLIFDSGTYSINITCEADDKVNKDSTVYISKISPQA